MSRQRKRRTTRGVPTGFHHKWRYSPSLWEETKLKDSKGRTYWKVRWRASKGKKARGYGGYPKGFRGTWAIKGKQYIRKTGKGRYQTEFRGTKRPLKFYK